MAGKERDVTLQRLDSQTEKMYRNVLTPLGARYQMDIHPPRKPKSSKPTVLFLGNHSSGKSTFINFLLGRKVQKTGIAPTDDGFTVLTYSETPEESSGPAAAMRPEITFTSLDRFGPTFLARLRLKLLDAEFLKDMNLVDSPGMIDAASTAMERGYDFMAAVRAFGESADLILFFLDPEKPGTTGETVAAFTKALSGLENKIMILMNKADEFDSLRDFARDYGALCWNLSRVIQTKDMPEIFTTYIPNARSDSGSAVRGIPLDGFDEAREEVIRETKRALSRRVDNVISTLTEQAWRLDMHIRVSWELKRRVLRVKGLVSVITFLLLLGTIGLFFAFRDATSFTTPLFLVCGGTLATILWWAIGRLIAGRVAGSLTEHLDDAFERAYKRDFTMGQRDDLVTRWNSIRDHVENVFDLMGPESIPGHSPKTYPVYRKLQRLLTKDIAKLRAV